MWEPVDLLPPRIEAFIAEEGGGVVVRKFGGGYSLYREGSGRPVSRLRPTGAGDAVEVKWWSERWDDVGDFGPIVLPLDRALTFLAEDPVGCFWH